MKEVLFSDMFRTIIQKYEKEIDKAALISYGKLPQQFSIDETKRDEITKVLKRLSKKNASDFATMRVINQYLDNEQFNNLVFEENDNFINEEKLASLKTAEFLFSNNAVLDKLKNNVFIIALTENDDVNEEMQELFNSEQIPQNHESLTIAKFDEDYFLIVPFMLAVSYYIHAKVKLNDKLKFGMYKDLYDDFLDVYENDFDGDISDDELFFANMSRNNVDALSLPVPSGLTTFKNKTVASFKQQEEDEYTFEYQKTAALIRLMFENYIANTYDYASSLLFLDSKDRFVDLVAIEREDFLNIVSPMTEDDYDQAIGNVTSQLIKALDEIFSDSDEKFSIEVKNDIVKVHNENRVLKIVIANAETSLKIAESYQGLNEYSINTVIKEARKHDLLTNKTRLVLAQ